MSSAVAERDQIIEMIQKMPLETKASEIIDQIYFRMQVDAGLKELDEGKGIPHADIKKEIAQWLTK